MASLGKDVGQPPCCAHAFVTCCRAWRSASWGRGRCRAWYPFFEVVQEMFPDTWHSYLHVCTSGALRVLGSLDDAIVGKGQRPIGNFTIPQDLPEFYKGRLRDLSVEESWKDEDRVVEGASRWVSPQVERVVSALRGRRCAKSNRTLCPPCATPL